MLAKHAERTQGKSFWPHRPPEKMNLESDEGLLAFAVGDPNLHLILVFTRRYRVSYTIPA